MLRAFAERLMNAEVSAICNAEYGERTPERLNSRNGTRPRQLDTRVGTIELAIPKLREGSYYPGWLLEPRRRAERALTQVICQCYVEGVSTRRVDDVVKAMGIEGISKSQVSQMASELDTLVEAFRSRPLDAGPYPYLWLDALTQKGARRRLGGQRRRRHRDGRQLRGTSRGARHGRDHDRGRGWMDGVPARPRSSRPYWCGPCRLRRPQGLKGNTA